MLLQGGGAAWIRIARTQPIKITFEQRNTMTGGLEVIGGLKEQEISHFCHNLRIASGKLRAVDRIRGICSQGRRVVAGVGMWVRVW